MAGNNPDYKLFKRITGWFLEYHSAVIHESETIQGANFDFDLLRLQLAKQIIDDMKEYGYRLNGEVIHE